MDKESLDKTYVVIHKVHFFGSLLAFVLMAAGLIFDKALNLELGIHLLKAAVYVVIATPVCRVLLVGLHMLSIKQFLLTAMLFFSFLFVASSFF